MRMLSGASDWAQVVLVCSAAPAELARDPQCLRLKAEAQIAQAVAGKPETLKEALKTLEQ